MIQNITAASLRKAASIQEKIDSLQAELANVLGGGPTATAVTKQGRNLSPEGRARIVAAQKARWAKLKRKPRK